MAFLPQDYQPPRTTGSYMKLQDGENKIRILSSPVLGWEEWIDNKPIRYWYKDKPESWANPERPGKHFWALIVWNHSEERIQILHITQASIRKALESLVKDKDWGDPFFYDIKITKSGKDLKTKYAVNPLPHKPVDDYIHKAFDDNPCNLEALFTGDDPFGEWEHYTSGVFSRKTVTKEQVQELNDLIGDDEVYKEKVLQGLEKMFGVKSLSDIPQDKYDSVLKSVKLHAKERLEREMDDNLPF